MSIAFAYTFSSEESISYPSGINPASPNKYFNSSSLRARENSRIAIALFSNEMFGLAAFKLIRDNKRASGLNLFALILSVGPAEEYEQLESSLERFMLPQHQGY